MSDKADYRDASRIEHMYAALCRVKELSAGIARVDFVEGRSYLAKRQTTCPMSSANSMARWTFAIWRDLGTSWCMIMPT